MLESMAVRYSERLAENEIVASVGSKGAPTSCEKRSAGPPTRASSIAAPTHVLAQ
jgi:hypothetical protein